MLLGAAGAALAPTAEIVVETAGRHRVRVVGLTSEELSTASAAAEPALAVFTGTSVPGADVPAILGTVRADAGALVFEPRFPFVPGLRYTARLERPGQPAIVRTFEVPAPTGDRPRVTGVFPSGDSLPANTLRIYVHFSEPMEARDAPRRVHLFDAGGGEVELPFVEIEDGLWDPMQTRLTLLFHPGRLKRGVGPGDRMGAPLQEGGAYRLVVDAGARNRRGQTLAASFERRFRVGAADRVSPRVEDFRVAPPAAPEDDLAVTLPEPLDEALLRRLVWVEDGGGARLDGQVTIDGGETRWRFRPDRPWAPGAYALRVHPALEDRAGNRFDRLFDRSLPGSAGPAEGSPLHLPFEVAPQLPR